MDFIYYELIERFLGYSVFLPALILISLGPLGIIFFYIVPIITTAKLYTKKRKLIWLSVLPQVAVCITFFVRGFIFSLSTDYPLRTSIIDTVMISVTIVFHFGAIMLLTMFAMKRIEKRRNAVTQQHNTH